MPPIPVNAYRQDFTAAKKRYGADGLVAMLHDMLAIREFESMLNSIKTTGGWQGIEYNHKGPAHLSMGQEASAVGQAAGGEGKRKGEDAEEGHRTGGEDGEPGGRAGGGDNLQRAGGGGGGLGAGQLHRSAPASWTRCLAIRSTRA